MKSKASYLALVALLFASQSLANEVSTFLYTASELGGTGSVTGTIVLDASVEDTIADPTAGLYTDAATWTGDILGGDQDRASFSFDALEVVLFNFDAPPLDSLTVIFGSSNLILSDITGTAFESDQLPSVLNVESFSLASLLINSQDISGNQAGPAGSSVLYNITSITAVPEPTSALVFFSTLAWGVFCRRRPSNRNI